MEEWPAFPLQTSPGNYYEGMSLREWYIGMALSAIGVQINPGNPISVAKAAVAIADAIMKELNP